MTKKVIIIGSGIAGLALSARLKLKGYDVHVYEKNKSFGGKLSDFKLDDFRHDFGPKLFTMPELLEDLFYQSGKNIDNYLKYKRLEIACKYFWKNGKTFNAFSNKKKIINEIVKEFNVNEKELEKYFKNSKNKFVLTKRIFLEKSLHKLSTYLSFACLKAILNIFKLDIFKSLNQVNKKAFNDERLISLFNRFATYNGSNPFLTSGIMSMIQYLEHENGVFIPKNGIIGISDSVYRLSQDLGVSFYFNSNVEKIIIKNNKAVGIQVFGKEIFSDIVISNMDINLTYEKLLSEFKKPNFVKNSEPSSSAIVFYWNMNKEFKQLDIHNIIFSNNQEEEFDFIFTQKLISSDPTIYICSTSKEIKEDAPKGCENWFILINSPYDSGQDWERIKKDLRKNIIKKIEETLKTKIENNIINEKILTPKDIEAQTLSMHGSLYGNSSNSLKSAFLRHPNFSKKIKNLYFCGGSVHPGGGIPLCLNSAKIVADLIK